MKGRLNKTIFGVFAAAACIAVCLCLLLKSDTPVQANTTTGSTILENDTVTLQLVNDYSELQLTDKRTGIVWSSSMTDSNFDTSTVAKTWQKQMSSLFVIGMTNLDSGMGVISTVILTNTDYTAEEYETEDGFGVIYDLTTAGIKVALEFSLTDDGMKIRIPYEKIDEYGGTWSLVYLNLMMFFGARTDGSEGYFFYPDGSGAIMEFADDEHYTESSVTYSIYGNILNNDALLSMFDESDPIVYLPVFGGNYGDTGYVAYVTEGAETAKITVNPSGKIIGVNYMYSSYYFRRGFDDARVTSKTVQVYDSDLIPVNYEICFELLEEGSAEYDDMAVAYREYLVENGLMSKLEIDSNSYGLSLQLFMAAMEEGLIFDTLRVVTTFDQAQEILSDLLEEIDADLKVSLEGWSKKGYGSEPNFFPANSKLGGNSGLKELAEYAAENGIELSLAANFLTVSSESGGYSSRNDVVYLNNYKVLTDAWESVYLLSPDKAYNNFTKFARKASSYDISGIKFDNIGSMVIYNYNSGSEVTAQECIEYWLAMLQETKDTYGSVTVEGGNAYVLSVADMVTDIPTTDSNYQMTTKSVPFYQIVVHGYVEYTGEALNLASNFDKTLLKYIEYGYLPYFELTYESADYLIDTDYNELFTSQYSSWKDRVVEAYEAMSEALGDVRTQAITSHEEVASDVYCTTYENGTRIYVNYTSSAVTVDGVEVGSMDYSVVKGTNG